MAYRLGQVLLLFIENRHGIGVRITKQDKNSQSVMEGVSAFSLVFKHISLLCIHADKFSSNLSGIECPVRITV
jgi:hypothetical protein